MKDELRKFLLHSKNHNISELLLLASIKINQLKNTLVNEILFLQKIDFSPQLIFQGSILFSQILQDPLLKKQFQKVSPTTPPLSSSSRRRSTRQASNFLTSTSTRSNQDSSPFLSFS